MPLIASGVANGAGSRAWHGRAAALHLEHGDTGPLSEGAVNPSVDPDDRRVETARLAHGYLGLGGSMRQAEFRVFRSFEEARAAELAEEAALSPEQRQAIARALRERHFGTDCVDIRASGEARKFRRLP